MRRTLALVLLTALAAVAAPAAASAATITVTSNADTGAGTLRAALASAGPGDTVAVPAMTITLSSGALAVPGGVTIQGQGARATTISGGNTSGVFNVQGAGVTIQSVTITKGMGANGGGVASSSGLTLSHVAIVYNTASSSGGGAYVGGAQPLVVDHSLIAHNQAPSGSGGGLYYAAGAGSSITDTTIAYNTASSAAGGVYITANGLLLDADTLVGNAAPSGQGGNLRDQQNFKMRDTILAGGIAASGGDCYMSSTGTWTSLGYNAEDTDPTPDQGGPNTCQYYFNGTTDRTNLTLQLGQLQNNGGPTDTILPAATSPLIDKGDPANCLADDQRGVPRPQGSGCDIGAVERSIATSFSGFADTLTTTTAVLHGSANTQGLGGTAHFVYGPTASFGAVTPDTLLGASTSSQVVTATITGLVPSTTYYFALVVSTPDGVVTGTPATFTTSSSGGGGGGGTGGGGGGGGTGGGGSKPGTPQLSSNIDHKKHSAKFTFSDQGATGLECALTKLNAGRAHHARRGGMKKKHGRTPSPSYSSCTSPKTYKHLKSGKYEFFVRGVNGAGKGAPATKRFTI